VKITIQIPLPIYDGLLDKFEQSSLEYELLRNGVIIRCPQNDHYDRIVEIACDRHDAALLYDTAVRLSPQAAIVIANCIRKATHRF
jgi:hypothetical protein